MNVVIVVAPAGMVTLAGTLMTLSREPVSMITAPPAGAGLFNVTCAELPLLRFRISSDVSVGTPGGATMTTNCWELLLHVAVIVAEAGDVRLGAVIVNVVLHVPAGTVTLAGTVATDVLLLDSVTAVPRFGAAILSVTVAVPVVPAVTTFGVGTGVRKPENVWMNDPDLEVGCLTVSPTVLVVAECVAETLIVG
jgi:hypothetical protein